MVAVLFMKPAAICVFTVRELPVLPLLLTVSRLEKPIRLLDVIRL